MHKPTAHLIAPIALCLVTACGTKEKEELLTRVNEANDQVLACKKTSNELKNEVGSLKRQLAQAMSNPSRVVLTDPEVIELIASLKGPAPAGEEPLLGKGALDPRAASKIVMGNAQGLQICYERALKKNSALQFQAGLAVTLGITVKPQGTVESIDVKPSVDQGMTSCIQTAIMRWKFPPFAGSPVTIEQKLTLTPKT
jgi:hypothetical protein